MAGISGQGTTFNLPNFVGELFAVTPTDTPFLSAIGGLTGGESADATLFQWQGYDLRSADWGRQRLEGANAPTAEQRVRFIMNNVVEVHQEALEVTYTKLAAKGQYSTTGSTHPHQAGLSGTNPVMAELDWQVEQHLIQIARDVEVSFLSGEFANPATNATPRRTRGIIEATTTNVVNSGTAEGTATIATDGTFTIASHGMANGTQVTVANLNGGADDVLNENVTYYVRDTATNTFKLAAILGGAAITFAATGGADVFSTNDAGSVLTEPMILNLLQTVWENGGISMSETATLMSNASLKRALTKIFITDKGYQEASRSVGGVHVMTIETDFGILNIMLNRHMPTSIIQVVSLEECSPVFLPIPGKGFLFVEELAKQGAAERSQIYGEIGLKYGNEKTHGKIMNVKAA